MEKVEKVYLNGSNCISETVPCDHCDNNKTTRHVCLKVDQNGIRELVHLDRTKPNVQICGLATCVECDMK